ncbi:class I SAM-dependent methyltransferase [Streptomyces tremellae]|uniref:S-adenosyl-L-methionine-dependent methyltransferase n=1 Tax=Streptomyces tremellae TaxID=1124239 RepID=A0ABP7G7H6_9ACTN
MDGNPRRRVRNDEEQYGLSPVGAEVPVGEATAPGAGDAGVEGGVGATALLVAAARAIESHRPDALVHDPYAEHFVRAAGASAGWPLRPEQVPGGGADPLWGRLGRYFALRTRALDDALREAAGAGIRQFVLLGAGLDTRAYRLRWPEGTTVWEVDRPNVLAFKERILAHAQAVPAAGRVAVPADLRENWAPRLPAAGLDPAAPTGWLAEGVLLYLPGAVERHLLAAVDELSAPRSTLCYEIKPVREVETLRDSPVYAATRDRLGVDLLRLFEGSPRPDSASDLAARGWRCSVQSPFDHTRRYGRGPLPEPDDALAANRWVFAEKTTSTAG